MTETDLCYLSALQLRELYQKGEVSPVEVTEAILRRMDQLNPSLNAFITMTPELALEGARLAEQAYQTDESPPPVGWHPNLDKRPCVNDRDSYNPRFLALQRFGVRL